VNIFDFDQEIYGETIRLDFFHFIREDQKFNSLEELKSQLGQDRLSTIKLLKD
jgi:riboflavin kinase/FMN adenylyltransferase